MATSNNIDTLVLTAVGFVTREFIINNQSEIIVSLIKNLKSLDEVVLTGYTGQRRKDITGAVSVVEVENLKGIPSGSAMQALQGLASGVNVISTGVPGSQSKIFIRGVSSFGSTQPLVLVDGVQADINNVSSDDIQSMQVLKDAGAASIYGVRGANGVIIITTKKGKTGVPLISYDGYYGVTVPYGGNVLNTLNSEDFARLTKIYNPGSVLFKNGIPDYMYASSLGSGVAMEGDPLVDPAKYNLDPRDASKNYLIQKINKTGTDWYHAMFKTAPFTSHNVTVSGGGEKANYLLSLGYLDQQGSVIETFLKRYSARINSSFTRKFIRIGENINVLYKRAPGFNNQGEFAPMANLYKMMPITPVYDIAGNFGGTFAGPELGSDGNPVASQKRTLNNRFNEWNVTGNVFLELFILKKITARTSVGGFINNAYQQGFSFTAYNDKQGFNSPNSYSESASYNGSSIFTNTINYIDRLGLHSINILVGSEAIKNYGRGVAGGAQDFFSTDYNYLILANGTRNVTNSSSAYINTLFSLFGKLDYNFNERYLLGATLRRDGSSKFGPETRYAFFPSFSLGWRISNEKFISMPEVINDLKLRGSYGILGSESNISASNAFTLFGGGFGTSYYDISGTSNSIKQGFIQTTIGNPSTGWEKNIVSNIGLDAVLFDNSLNVSIDYYKKTIEGLLFTQPLPALVGGATRPTVNIGNIGNKGWDISVNYKNSFSNGLAFNIGTNITTYKNKILDVPDPGYFDAGGQQQLGQMVRNKEGMPASSFFGYKVIGLFKDSAEINSAPSQTGAKPGRFRYADINQDNKITPDDRTFLGDPNPDFTYGISLGFDFKGFDLSSILYGTYGNEAINALKVNTHFFGTYVGGKSNDLLNAWTPENTNTDIPLIESGNNFSTAGTMNSFFVENGSYLRLRSLTLGYTFHPKILEKISVSKLRVYLQGTNLFTITKYSGLDPELGGNSGSFGIDYGNYPNNLRGYFFGLNVSF